MKRTGLLAVIAVMFMAAMLAQSRQPAGTSHTGKAFRFNKVKDGTAIRSSSRTCRSSVTSSRAACC